jgi:hypothetical protein
MTVSVDLAEYRPAPSPAGDAAALELRRPTATILAIALLSSAVVGAAAAVRPLMGLGLVLAIAAALALAQRPQLAVLTMVTIAPATAGLQRGLLVPGLRVSEIAIAGLGCLVLLFASRTRRPAWTPVEKTLLIYAVATVALGGFDLANRHAPLNTDELGTLLGPFQFVILLRAVVVSLRGERERVLAARLMLGAATVVALLSLAQYAGIGPVRTLLADLTGSSLYASSLGEGVGRVTGPFNIWHELAGFLMPSVLLSLTLMLGSASREQRNAYGGVFVLTTMALLSTATAGVLIATVLGALYIAWRRRVLHVALPLVAVIGVLAAVLLGSTLVERADQQYQHTATTNRIPLVPESISYRYALFEEQTTPALAGRLVTGYGPDLPAQLVLGNFPYVQTSYLLLLLRGGIPLLIVFLLLIGAVLATSVRAVREARGEFEESIATVVLITTVAYVFLQLIESYLLDSGPPQVYWALVGLMLAAMGAKNVQSARATRDDTSGQPLGPGG